MLVYVFSTHGVHTTAPELLYVPAGHGSQSANDVPFGFKYCPAGHANCFTSTVAVSLLFPSTVVAVIVTVPIFLPATTPFSSTVAIVESLLDHVTDLFGVLSGFTVAVKATVSFIPITEFFGVTFIFKSFDSHIAYIVLLEFAVVFAVTVVPVPSDFVFHSLNV